MASHPTAMPSEEQRDGLPEDAPAPVPAFMATKSPPAESREAVIVRRRVLMSFWLLVLLVGVPFWWHTTTVYRASLPYSTMDSWATGAACDFSMTLLAELDNISSDKVLVDFTKNQTQDILNEHNDLWPHKILLGSRQGLETNQGDPSLSISIQQDVTLSASQLTAHLEPHPDSQLTDLVVKSPNSVLTNAIDPGSQLPSFLASELETIFGEERAMITRLEEARKGYSQTSLETLVKGRETEIERRQQRSMKYASTYHLTFSLFTPEATPSAWEIESALAETIQPLLKALSGICNFTIDTQVQPYAQFSGSVQPEFNAKSKSWELKSTDLGGFINAAEWPLSPSIGAGPTINFLLYVPAESQTPLDIQESDSTSWLILQWGGIAIYNPSNAAQLAKTGTLTAAELREPFLTFSQHLLDLLGLPSPNLPFQLRLQSQTRILAVRLLSSASATLGSLARLTQTLTSISVPDTVASSVDLTISHLDSACAALDAGDFQAALNHAKIADEESEKAFFHKSMVGQVYFPDEHKVAVYLPLLGPVAVPLVMTAIKELQSWSRSRRKAG